MKKKLILALWLICVILTVAACGSSGSVLEKNKWMLSSYGEVNNLKTVLADTEITAEFDKGRGEIIGSGGCNTYFATYKIDGNNLSISNLAWTEMACLSPDGIMEQEQEFLSLLAGADVFQVNDTALTITSSDGRNLYFTVVAR